MAIHILTLLLTSPELTAVLQYSEGWKSKTKVTVIAETDGKIQALKNQS